MAKEEKNSRPEIRNRKARFDYHIDKTYEAGIALEGTEVKSIRQGNANLTDAFATLKKGEVWLMDAYIKPYDHQGTVMNHDARRARKLLLNKKEIRELDKQINQKGVTVIPLKMYFKGPYVKVLIGLARGKKQYDKRQSIKEADTKREIDKKIKGSYKVNL